MQGLMALIVGLVFSMAAWGYQPQAGDIVFHTSLSRQSVAVQAATGSSYSHMGMVLWVNGAPVVLEAVQPVKYTALAVWLNRGKGKHYVIKRLKKPLPDVAIQRLYAQAPQYVGKPYDLSFDWSDQRMYCSELVWKLYQSAAGIQLAPLKQLSSFNLNNPLVLKQLHQRYGTHVPLHAPVIAPSDIFNSPLLVTVDEQ